MTERHVERHRPGKPARPHVTEYPAVDFYRAEQVLVDRKRAVRVMVGIARMSIFAAMSRTLPEQSRTGQTSPADNQAPPTLVASASCFMKVSLSTSP